ncbi:MAG: virulence RhuM family protein [Bacilli bacterium]|nr:virulence RhuM family protein [Bacilli bacterium]
MNNKDNNYELIKFEDGDFSLDVKVSPNEDTVWLTQQQISDLYGRDISVISRHIKNIMYEKECTESNLQKMQIPFSDKPVVLYDLEFIISIGYRIKSMRGVMFRRWANSILKQYLLNGYVINKDRVIAYQSNILKLEASFINIENRLKNLEETVYADNDLIVFEGEILEPYTFLRKLFFLAKVRIIIIDNYADSFLLSMLSDIKVNIIIYTANNSYLYNTNIKDNISIINTDLFHDRYLIIDDITYTMGTSFNSIGKKRFTITRLKDITADMLTKSIKKVSI